MVRNRTGADSKQDYGTQDSLIRAVQKMFGPVLHQLTFGKAIERDLLVPWPAETAEKRYLERFAMLARYAGASGRYLYGPEWVDDLPRAVVPLWQLAQLVATPA